MTLVEVLLSVSVLAIGMTFLFPTFFRSIQVLDGLSDRYGASLVANELAVEFQDKLHKEGSFQETVFRKKVAMNRTEYSCRIESKAQNYSKDHYELAIEVRWGEAQQYRFASSALVSI